jgi:iron(III) transport system substrate-binding protein
MLCAGVLALFLVLGCIIPSSTFAAAAPSSIPQLALYSGTDREKILIEGAKREGQFTLYTSHTWFRTFVKEFEKKYPFVKASEWRNDSKNLIRKVFEESKAGRVLVDVVETTADGMGIMKREGLFQEYFSPEARFYPNELKPKGKSGFFYLPNRETYNSLGFNNKLIPPATAPRILKDLLDPKWKGKMAITSTSTGVRWIGNALESQGREYIDKIAEQEISVQDMAPAALINLVGSGEIPLSPTIFDANVTIARQKGSPVEWRPLEPVVTTVGSAALMAKASNPHTALLFIDYLLSREGQQLIMKGGLWSPREDVGTVEQKFKKSYLDEKYPLEEIEAKYAQWENLLRQLFIRKVANLLGPSQKFLWQEVFVPAIFVQKQVTHRLHASKGAPLL